jgi:DNA-binding transcriptional LysR family regulator
MDMLQAIRAFAQVASVGSFTTAAQELGVVTSAVSRSIADLETHLNIRLLHRTTRRVALTEAGERYLSHCQVILKQLAQAEAEAFGTSAEPSGTLKIGVTASFDRYHLPGLISSYQERFPQVSVSVSLAQQVQEAMLSRHDVLLHCSPESPEPSISSECLGAMSSILCASPVYLARYGMPQTLNDLKQHRCIDLAGDPSSGQWMFDGPFGHEEACSVGHTVLQSDLSDVVSDSVQAGLGIGPLPVRVGMQQLRAGSVVRVLPDYRMKARNVFVLYSSPVFDTKIKAWIEFLKETLPQRLARDEAAFAQVISALPYGGVTLGDNTQIRPIQESFR